jgi:cation transporter-like permease
MATVLLVMAGSALTATAIVLVAIQAELDPDTV